MVSSKVVVKNPTGLHLRPAGLLCNLALEYTSKVTIHFKDINANAKSILGVLAACVKSGDEIEIICEGSDEKEALTTIVKAIEDGLGEKF
ncbi:MAG: Phosphotransferase System HPr (HPr) Family [Lachnospiraceae bacterium]|jgi:phosphocarrier protein|nr:Phosphotransferase System HPr (HPr) Family [Lachnospiraceae bacterium]